MVRTRPISNHDYAQLLRVRTRLRQFEQWSAEQAATRGLTASQHQLLLAIRGHDEPEGPTIGQIAEYLFIKHHTAVELVGRCEQAGLVTRSRDLTDHRAVRLGLTPSALKTLQALASAHIKELSSLTSLFQSLIADLATR